MSTIIHQALPQVLGEALDEKVPGEPLEGVSLQSRREGCGVCSQSGWVPKSPLAAGVVLYTHSPSAVSSCVRWRSKGLSYRVSNALAHHAQQWWQTLQATGAEELLLPTSPLFMKRYGRGQKQWAKSLCAGLSLSLVLSSAFTDLLPLLEAPWFAFFPHWTSWGWDESCWPDFLTVQEKGCPMWAHHVSEFYIFTTVYL